MAGRLHDHLEGEPAEQERPQIEAVLGEMARSSAHYKADERADRHGDGGEPHAFFKLPSAVVSEELLYEVTDGVGRATINRPERRNSLSWGVISGLRDVFAQAKDDPNVRVIVLTG